MKTAPTRIVDSLQALQAINEPSVPILSVYLNLLPYSDETRTVTARLRDQLKPLEVLAEKLDHGAATSLRRGIARALEMAPSLEAHRGHGWAFFVCDELGLEEVVILPPAGVGLRDGRSPAISASAVGGYRRIPPGGDGGARRP